ncbi:MAG: T9SS type A sorting domain-containing protein, partial [Candidatus Latescibacteria bacterium]|nr:T9SS type A sorting domain-containing protein [Candidatus Latescibacterota bacterium]
HPEELPIIEVHPNPFNPRTTISYSLPEAADVKLDVYSICGQKIETLIDGFMNVGIHTALFDASKHGSGIYIYRFQAGEYVKTGKMVMVK